MFCILFFALSLESSVRLALTTHLSLEQPPFKWSVATGD